MCLNVRVCVFPLFVLFFTTCIHAQDHMPGGKFYTPSEGGIGGQVTATYSAGQEIDAEFVITAHHRGWLYLRLCDEARVTEACLEKYPPLERVRFEDDELIQAQPIF